MAFDLGNLLQQYLGGAAGNNGGRAVDDDFDQVAQNAPRSTVAQGVTEALRSDQTPPFAQMVGQLFGNSDPGQRAGMLNQLIANAGPGLLSSIAGGAFGNLLGGADTQAPITPEQAAQLTPEQVQRIAEDAERHNPSIVERMGDFYAEHPDLVKTIGGAALAIVLGRVAEGMRQ
jgi:hypothetical protein